MVKPVLISTYRIKKLEFSKSQSLSCGGFLNTSTWCSVKCLSGLELLFDSLLTVVVLHVSWLVLIVVFRSISVVHNPVSRVNSFSIAMWS
jgi:hypothetical protein